MPDLFLLAALTGSSGAAGLGVGVLWERRHREARVRVVGNLARQAGYLHGLEVGRAQQGATVSDLTHYQRKD